MASTEDLFNKINAYDFPGMQEVVRNLSPGDGCEALQVIAAKLGGMFPKDSFQNQVWQIARSWRMGKVVEAQNAFRKYWGSLNQWTAVLGGISMSRSINAEERKKVSEGEMLLWAAISLACRGLNIIPNIDELPSAEFISAAFNIP